MTKGIVSAKELAAKSALVRDSKKAREDEYAKKAADKYVEEFLRELPDRLQDAAEGGKTSCQIAIDLHENAANMAAEKLKGLLKEKGYRCTHSRSEVRQFNEDGAWTEVYFSLFINW